MPSASPLIRCTGWRESSTQRGAWTAPPAAQWAPSATWRTGWSWCARMSPTRALSTRAGAPTAWGPAPVRGPGARSTNGDRSLMSSTWAETGGPTDRPATGGKKPSSSSHSKCTSTWNRTCEGFTVRALKVISGISGHENGFPFFFLFLILLEVWDAFCLFLHVFFGSSYLHGEEHWKPKHSTINWSRNFNPLCQLVVFFLVPGCIRRDRAAASDV